MEIAILLGVFLTSVACLRLLFKLRMQRRLELIDWFAVSLGVLNGVGYVFVICAAEAGLNPWAQWLVDNSQYYWLFPTLSLIAFLGVYLGASLGKAIFKPRIPAQKFTAGTTKYIKRLAWSFFVLGVLTYWVYARAYGGFLGLLRYSPSIRSGLFEQVGIYNPWSFLQRLGGLCFFSSFLFYALSLSKEPMSITSRAINFVGLGLSICFSSYVLYTWLGRLDFVSYCIVFPFGYVYFRSFSLKARQIFIMLAITIAVIFAFPSISRWMTPGKTPPKLAELYAKELSFPAVSFFSVLHQPEFRGGQDLVYSLVYFLPERVWRGVFGITTASDVNTERIYGYRKGEGGVTGAIPTDFITFSYMQFGIAGVAILSTFCGGFLVWLDKLILLRPHRALRAVLYAYSAIMISALTVLYADPVIIIHRNIHFVIGMLVLSVIEGSFRKRPRYSYMNNKLSQNP